MPTKACALVGARWPGAADLAGVGWNSTGTSQECSAQALGPIEVVSVEKCSPERAGDEWWRKDEVRRRGELAVVNDVVGFLREEIQ